MEIMPKGAMDGIEAAEALQSRLNVPIIYLTGYADSSVFEREKRTNPCGYLVKPFSTEKMPGKGCRRIRTC
jgi:two-component system, response regulator PdtaR